MTADPGLAAWRALVRELGPDAYDYDTLHALIGTLARRVYVYRELFEQERERADDAEQKLAQARRASARRAPVRRAA